jgi:nicotinate-nucleotide adenylyltransferase
VTRLGIFGGTFDPPHLGHLILAAEAFDQLKLERVLWVLTPNPPHKQHQLVSPVDVRLQMLQAALGTDPAFEISSVDINRYPPHYAVDTVHLLTEQYPGADLFYLLGGDSLHDLPYWYQPREFIDGCAGLGVMRRPGDQIDLALLESALAGISPKIHFIDSPLLEISSKQVRERIFEGHSYRYYLPDAVYQFIRDNSLYI